MGKVYCRNCIYGRCCGIQIRKSKEIHLIKHETLEPGEVVEIHNEFEECCAYQRKWWKFWAK